MEGGTMLSDINKQTYSHILTHRVLKSYLKDKGLCLILATALGGVGVYTYKQLSLPQIQAQFQAGKERRAARNLEVTKGPEHKTKRSGAPAVDKLFLQRLAFILRIVVPGLNTREAFLLASQGFVLVARSLLSLRIARRSGDGLQAVMEKSWKKFAFCIADFYVAGVAASVINSALKYLTNSITVAFRRRLTTYVHTKYLEGNSYYKAAVLRTGNLDNADQRIVEDLNKFCSTAADLFSRTFKPALDVVLSTRRMAENMGYKGLAILYSYFVLSGAVVRHISPAFPKYIAQQQALEGDFRRSHSRLITNAEEVAFLDGSEREKMILNTKLANTTAFSEFYYLLQFGQGCVDQYTLKYLASIIGWPILAIPFLANEDLDMATTAARYRESDTLIQAASSSIGDLMMVYKKLQQLAGFTTRVVELLEAVEISKADEAQSRGKLLVDSSTDSIVFDKVSILAPDHRLLIREVDLKITPGRNIFVTGANGAGKTSMFRVLAGLWQAAEGNVVRPVSGLNSNGTMSLFYVPQRPYLVTGSLRDQVTYPSKIDDGSTDRRVLDCLEKVNMQKFADKSKSGGLDNTPHDWSDVLSGGEKQRIGLARLYYHRPKFAVLDEATSAINPDEEGKLYEHLNVLGITVFSIAHRMELKRFHQQQLHFKADGTGAWVLEDL